MFENAPKSDRIVTPWRAACIFVLILAAATFSPSMSGLPIWDDHALIGGNGIGGGKSLLACITQPFLLHYFRPLVSISFFVDHRLFGSGPFFYHQTNLIIHILTTLGCLALFESAFRTRTAALLGGALFAVQPSQVSTVAWIGGRTDSLCTLFLVVFAWSLIRSAQADAGRRARWTALSATAFGLALLTKEQALSTLPLVPLAFRCFSGLEPKAGWRIGLRYWTPYIVVGAAFIAAWCAFYPSPHPPVMHGIAEQAALAGRSLTYYAALLLVPSAATLHLFSVGRLEQIGMWSLIPGYLILGGTIYWTIKSMRARPACAWFGAFVLAGVLPVANLIPLPSLVVAPYRVGVCGPAVAALLGFLFAGGIRRRRTELDENRTANTGESDSVQSHNPPAGPSNRWPRLRLAAGVAMIVWCAGLTWWGSQQWQDEITIFSTIVRHDPDSIVARFNLTTALLKQHRSAKALVQLDQLMTRLFRSRDWLDRDTTLAALKRDPSILVRIRENQGNAILPEGWLAALYGQRGFALLDAGKKPEAKRSFEIGLAIDRANDDVNLGMAQLAYDADNLPGALGYLRLVLAARPRRAEAHMLMGHAYAALGNWTFARDELETWASLQPWSGQAQVEVAQAHCRLGDFLGAQARLQFALANSICDVTEVRARLNDIHGRAGQFLN